MISRLIGLVIGFGLAGLFLLALYEGAKSVRLDDEMRWAGGRLLDGGAWLVREAVDLGEEAWRRIQQTRAEGGVSL